MSHQPPKGRASSGERDRMRWKLFHQFLLYNGAIILGLGAMAVLGWFNTVLTLDRETQYAVAVMVVVFCYGFWRAGMSAWWISRELNWARQSVPPPHSVAGAFLNALVKRNAMPFLLDRALQERLQDTTVAVRNIGQLLLFIGFTGTVLGFIIALSDVDPSRTRDVDAISTTVSTLIRGMGLALYTTFLGAIFGGIWLLQLRNMLNAGLSKLYVRIVERGGEEGGHV